MQELVNVGEDFFVFYNDKAIFTSFVEIMRAGLEASKESTQYIKVPLIDASALHYHIKLVIQWAKMCTQRLNATLC